MRTSPYRLLSALLVIGGLSARPAMAERPVLTVVIDPGHGGSNLGAPGIVEGMFEKKITLALGKLLRRRLERDGINVVTTRETDVYLTLAERVRRANAAGADLFVSLHANSTPEHTRRGFETFILAREVRDIEAGHAGAAPDPVDGMLARARVRHIARESARLSAAVRSHLGQIREGDWGSRQAPFDVLENLQMPAALIEIGFIDHAQEGVEITQPATLRRIADAIADGIESFGPRTADDPPGR